MTWRERFEPVIAGVLRESDGMSEAQLRQAMRGILNMIGVAEDVPIVEESCEWNGRERLRLYVTIAGQRWRYYEGTGQSQFLIPVTRCSQCGCEIDGRSWAACAEQIAAFYLDGAQVDGQDHRCPGPAMEPQEVAPPYALQWFQDTGMAQQWINEQAAKGYWFKAMTADPGHGIYVLVGSIL